MELTTGLMIYFGLLALVAFGAYGVLGTPIPAKAFLADFYEVQPKLYPAKVVLIFMFFAGVVTRLSHRQGLIDADVFSWAYLIGSRAMALAGIVFMALLLDAAVKRWRKRQAKA